MQVTTKSMLHTIVDKGASIGILSSNAWQALGSAQLVLATNQILAFNQRPTSYLGILSQFPITLEGKSVCIDVMVVQGPLDFNLLLGRDYVYAMKFLVPTLFRAMYFPDDGHNVTVDHLSSVKLDYHVTPNHHTSLNVPHILVVPSPSS